MRTRFTPKEDQFIIDNYLTMPNRKLSEVMGRSRSGIRDRMIFLNLTLPEEVKAERESMSRFKPGQTPPNKGMKQSDYMTDEAIERTKASRFSKGHIPKNSYNEIGKITIRNDKRGIPYKHICIKLGKWVYLHRHTWQEANGPIPAKHAVSFKDGDTMNCSLENLECITMAESMLRNSGSINLPDGMVAAHLAKNSRQVNKALRQEILDNHKDLIQAKRNQLLIDRKIKSLTKKHV